MTAGTEHPLNAEETGPLDAAIGALCAWDPDWTDACLRMATSPWHSKVLSRRLIELICVGLNAACTNLNRDGTRRHIRRALEAGATGNEILLVLKCASVMAIHSCSLAAPILLEESKSLGVTPTPKQHVETPACDQMKSMGQWNVAWDAFRNLDPGWTDAFITAGVGIYASGVLPAKEMELLSVAFDASFTHMYAPGTRRHIRAALQAGASVEEVMEVLKLCVGQGAQALNLGVPILAEELAAGAGARS
jgi:alkylhydroperoxidase/carboxymuconolactone decarboxylase family protein YurZ